MGAHWCDSLLLFVRGKILLEHNPADTAPAEEVLCAAVDIGRRQKAKSLELQAALSLAKLCHAAGRAADAHAVLAAALEGFSQTLEFPEIEEAQTLLVALS
jgi:hypothetical protein